MGERMIDQIAKAIRGGDPREWATMTNEDWVVYRTVAVTALKAARPSIATMDFVRQVAPTVKMTPTDLDLAVCAYIDAALSDK